MVVTVNFRLFMLLYLFTIKFFTNNYITNKYNTTTQLPNELNNLLLSTELKTRNYLK